MAQVLYYSTLKGLVAVQHPLGDVKKKVTKKRKEKHLKIRVYEIGEEIPPKEEGFVRFVCLSDTHNRHSELEMIQGDILIHAGDFTDTGKYSELESFATWLGSLTIPHKVVIGGNHDLSLDEEFYQQHWKIWHDSYNDPKVSISLLKEHCHLLHDDCVEIEGFRIYGNPYQPRQPKTRKPMAYGRTRGKELKQIWNHIPKGIDLLVTHTPPAAIGDEDTHIGDEELLIAVKRINPIVHIFGHCHAGRGVYYANGINFINAANKFAHNPLRPGYVFDLLRRK